MGSSPFTATIPAFLSEKLTELLQSGSSFLVAFSGGTDSTALLAALQQISPSLGATITAAHLDHALDDDSPRRRRRAQDLCAQLGVPLISERLTSGIPSGTSLEDWARQERYRFLHRWADALGAHFILTAHHADDQAETVLLRWLYGSGLEGLAGIRPRHGRIVRPLLDAPRSALQAWVESLGIDATEDPTNRDLARPRNLLRHEILPRMTMREPGLTQQLVRLADAAAHVRERLDRFFENSLHPRTLFAASVVTTGIAIDRRALVDLPDPLRDHALKWLHRHACAARPASAAARREFLRQLDLGIDAAGCDAGEGMRWECDASSVCLLRCESPSGKFAYTLRAPGVIELPELHARMRLRRGDRAEWMLKGHADRTGLTGLATAQTLEVRNRRPGDRLIPFGSHRRRKLKDLLIDRQVPRHARDRLPLLLVDGCIAWVPGVTIDERFRLGEETDEDVWIVELLVERERSES